MPIALIAVGAIAPAVMLAVYVYRKDLHREPGRLVLRVFAGGALATLAAAVLESVGEAVLRGTLTHAVVVHGFLSAFLLAACVEESLKYRVVLYAARQSAFDEPMDGIVYGAMASLGFAALENVAYVAHGSWQVAAVRAVLSVPGHAAYGAIAGYYVAQARFAPHWPHRARRGLWWAILLHGLYDWPALTVMAWRAARGPASPLPDAFAVTGFWMIGVQATAIAWAVLLIRRTRARQIEATRRDATPIDVSREV